jgi:hypothetical protein
MRNTIYEREHLSSQFYIIKFICTIFHCTLTWTRVRNRHCWNTLKIQNILKFNRKWKRKLRKQAKHYVSKDNLLYYVSAKGENRRVVREVLAIPIVPLVINMSSMSFKYRVRRCMVLELLYFNACSTVTKFNCNIEILKIWNIWNSIHNRLF